MKILAIETAAKAVSCAVAENGRILASSYQDTGLTHSRTLMPLVESMLKNAGLDRRELNAVAVSVGPGSFTGIRIGVSAAKGLAFGLELPCIPVSTLAALARNVSFAGGLIVCAMDARRQQIYNALFDAGDGSEPPRRLTEDRAVALLDLAEELRPDKRRKLVVGDGAALCADFLREHGVDCNTAPPHLLLENAASVALEAEQLAARGELLSPAELRPFYLRPPQALTLRERQAVK